MTQRTIEQRLATLEQVMRTYQAQLPVSSLGVALEARAAANLALAILEDFFSSQVGEGAIHSSVAVAALRRAMEAAANSDPELAPDIRRLVGKMLDRLEREAAERFE
jgi:hypothetical protein